MQVTSNQQIEFIAYIQRMLVEGDFVATYKYALLHALADICIEKPFADNPNSELKISFAEIVEKFIALYWQHALPFSAADNETYSAYRRSPAGLIKLRVLCRATCWWSRAR